MKYINFVIGIKQKVYILENGEKKSKEVYYYYYERVSESTNLYYKFKDIPNIHIIQWFATKKEAIRVMREWNDCARQNKNFKYDYIDYGE